ncbi:MAG: hypothetical protein QFC78_04195 [Pseudomonadota bacterium]|nr:hypothetical protein [Pseudomonadota bacterium]
MTKNPARPALRLFTAALFAACAIAALPAAAQDKSAPPRSIKDKSVNAVDVVATPVSDLGLRNGKIPPVLEAAVADPYDMAGIKTCAQISTRVSELDAVLGPDRDIPQDRAEKLSVGRVAQAAVGQFIPFRGIIREVSGANSHQRKVDDAVEAGTARRSFLKGYGQARGCAYPAREVTPAALASLEAQAARDKAEQEAAKAKAEAEKQRAHSR